MREIELELAKLLKEYHYADNPEGKDCSSKECSERYPIAHTLLQRLTERR